jgi:hypothetical protein
MNYWISHRKIFKRIALAATALMAIQLYFVQELIAAFLIFSTLFACIAVVVLIFFLLDQAWQATLDQVEIHARAFGRAARRSWERTEGLAMGRSFQFERLAAQPIPRTPYGTGREGRVLTQKSS